jgi:hypothetical protein
MNGNDNDNNGYNGSFASSNNNGMLSPKSSISPTASSLSSSSTTQVKIKACCGRVHYAYSLLAPRSKAARSKLAATHRLHGRECVMPFMLQFTNLAYLLPSVVAYYRHNETINAASIFYLLSFIASVIYHQWPNVDIFHRLDYYSALMTMSRHFYVVATQPWNITMLTAAIVCFASLGVLAQDRDEDMSWWHCAWHISTGTGCLLFALAELAY